MIVWGAGKVELSDQVVVVVLVGNVRLEAGVVRVLAKILRLTIAQFRARIVIRVLAEVLRRNLLAKAEAEQEYQYVRREENEEDSD